VLAYEAQVLAAFSAPVPRAGFGRTVGAATKRTKVRHAANRNASARSQAHT
jgi:hypothetical protein